MISDTDDEESMEMAFALPTTRMVVFRHLVMRMECEMLASISRMEPGSSKFSISHLFASRVFLGGFFVRMLSGLRPGMGDLPRPATELEDAVLWRESERVTVEGMLDWARREGFLWVCCEGSTLRRPEVTSEPRESSLKTAPMSGVLELAGAGGPGAGGPPAGGGGGGGGGGTPREGGGGGGGGGGAPLVVGAVAPDSTCLKASRASMPSLLFHVRAEG